MKSGKNIKAGPSEPTTVSLGTAATGVTAVSYDDGKDIVTTLTFSSFSVATITGGATAAYGKRIFDFPAGTHIYLATYVALEFFHTITNAAFKVGIGSVIATGAVNVLNGTATFMDYVTEQNAASDGAGGGLTDFLLTPTAGVLTGIALNKAAASKSVHLNVADTWPVGATSDLTCTGTIVLKWCRMG